MNAEKYLPTLYDGIDFISLQERSNLSIVNQRKTEEDDEEFKRIEKHPKKPKRSQKDEKVPKCIKKSMKKSKRMEKKIHLLEKRFLF